MKKIEKFAFAFLMIATLVYVVFLASAIKGNAICMNVAFVVSGCCAWVSLALLGLRWLRARNGYFA